MFLRFVFCTALVASTLGSVASAANLMVGNLPVYPNAQGVGFSVADPKYAMAMKYGAGVQLSTPDSLARVDAWYRSKLSSCTRMSAPGHGSLFTCTKTGAFSNRVRLFPYQGRTRIAYFQ